jgi:hypothetical protein
MSYPPKHPRTVGTPIDQISDEDEFAIFWMAPEVVITEAFEQGGQGI